MNPKLEQIVVALTEDLQASSRDEECDIGLLIRRHLNRLGPDLAIVEAAKELCRPGNSQTCRAMEALRAAIEKAK